MVAPVNGGTATGEEERKAESEEEENRFKRAHSV
ncbi:MAG: hypothetical protein ACJAQT_000818 [Akkermansiaceae bacterium]